MNPFDHTRGLSLQFVLNFETLKHRNKIVSLKHWMWSLHNNHGVISVLVYLRRWAPFLRSVPMVGYDNAP